MKVKIINPETNIPEERTILEPGVEFLLPTGMLDESGTEIWEGDIVERTGSWNIGFKCEIKRIPGGFVAEHTGGGCQYSLTDTEESWSDGPASGRGPISYKIIGSVYNKPLD